ncbi:proto-oncogene tyrosine-protein kinase ROS-like [Arvicola amphibius]|uniref:proto-oncogene tyrosine-protein kinase ROS-like n=1 Tax=Arvicola amphibius TaxID=1047088 RepID=UPI0018E2D5E9|nr:proto-oncogene tyrosine-protein kinase ROS-like [Arvicola amphibius]
MAQWLKAFAVKSDDFSSRNLVRLENLLPPCRFPGTGRVLTQGVFKAQGLILGAPRTGCGGTRQPVAPSIPELELEVQLSSASHCVTNLGKQLDIGPPYNLNEACIQGCQFWSSVDQEKCALKCNDTYTTISEREACEVGCSTAEGTYEEEVLESTELPTAPFASSIGTHSVTLRWNPANISGVKYIIQWKYDRLPGSWTYTETVPKLSYVVEPLHPFTDIFSEGFGSSQPAASLFPTKSQL